jgi:hypothetical protein
MGDGSPGLEGLPRHGLDGHAQWAGRRGLVRRVAEVDSPLSNCRSTVSPAVTAWAMASSNTAASTRGR